MRRWGLDLSKSRPFRLRAKSGSIEVNSLGVEQRVNVWWPGFGESNDAGIRHVFDLTVDAHHFDDHSGGTAGREVIIDELARYALPHAPEVLTPERLLVGRAEIDEFPVHVAKGRGGVADSLDGGGDEGPDLGAFALDITDEDSENFIELALIDGAFLWPRKLAIHPAFRGRRLGIRLLAHALFALHRSSSDVAAFEIGMMQSVFDTRRPRETKAALRRFEAYYRRIGFRPWSRVPSIVYLPIGLHGMPVRGLGGMSVRGS